MCWVVRVRHECPTLTAQRPWVHRANDEAQVVPDTRFVLMVVHLHEDAEAHCIHALGCTTVHDTVHSGNVSFTPDVHCS